MAYVGRKGRRRGLRGDPGIFGSIMGAIIPGYKVAATVVGAIKTGLGGRKQPSVSQAKDAAKNGGRPMPPGNGLVAGADKPYDRGVQPWWGEGAGLSRPSVRDGTVVQRDDTTVTACPPGQRPNKSAYFRMSPGGTLIFQPPGSTCVKSRRRNPLNPRAFDRALSRVGSAKRFGEKLGRVTIRSKCDCGRTRSRSKKK